MQAAVSGPGPLFFDAGDNLWLQPIPVYATRAVQTLAGNDFSARLTTVILASLNVALIFLAGRHAFTGALAPLLSAALLLATPAHIAYARSGTDAIFSVSFALLWLVAIQRYWVTDRAAWIAAAGVALGAGVYSNAAGPLTMAFLLAVSVIALITGRRQWRDRALIVCAFGAMLLPAAAWFAGHLDTYGDTFGRWAIHLAHVRNPIEGVQAFLNWNTLGTRASLYWGFLDPAWLFFGNMFLLVMLPLVALGLVYWPRVLARHSMTLIAGGAIVTPLAGSSFGVPHYAADALAFVPFAVLLMAAGAAALQRRFSDRVRRSDA